SSLAITTFVLWLLGVPYLKGNWLFIGALCLFVLLYWFDSIVRSTKEIEYQRLLMRLEIQRCVKAELDRRERALVKKKDPLAHRKKVVETKAEKVT
ncbi:MAG: hypothetical protein MJA29_11570, partial [Candidatus Omnitrophica bacterium]|nr:hypothetical protein [Candidatus Omnitrophota bacterium]